jgi:septin family protein
MLYLVDIFEFEFMKFRRVGLTLLAVLLCIQCSFATEYLLWLGYTQTGKSSCIKQLTGHESIEVGNSQKWKSTTERITIYHDRLNKLAHNYSHIDTIGFGDNRLD